MFGSIHLLYKEAKGNKGAYAEHGCYDCWAHEEDNPALAIKWPLRP